eukprot:6959248-Alexandrium_andersonii.AAC.1
MGLLASGTPVDWHAAWANACRYRIKHVHTWPRLNGVNQFAPSALQIGKSALNLKWVARRVVDDN